MERDDVVLVQIGQLSDFFESLRCSCTSCASTGPLRIAKDGVKSTGFAASFSFKCPACARKTSFTTSPTAGETAKAKGDLLTQRMLLAALTAGVHYEQFSDLVKEAGMRTPTKYFYYSWIKHFQVATKLAGEHDIAEQCKLYVEAGGDTIMGDGCFPTTRNSGECRFTGMAHPQNKILGMKIQRRKDNDMVASTCLEPIAAVDLCEDWKGNGVLDNTRLMILDGCSTTSAPFTAVGIVSQIDLFHGCKNTKIHFRDQLVECKHAVTMKAVLECMEYMELLTCTVEQLKDCLRDQQKVDGPRCVVCLCFSCGVF